MRLCLDECVIFIKCFSIKAIQAVVEKSLRDMFLRVRYRAANHDNILWEYKMKEVSD